MSNISNQTGVWLRIIFWKGKRFAPMLPASEAGDFAGLHGVWRAQPWDVTISMCLERILNHHMARVCFGSKAECLWTLACFFFLNWCKVCIIRTWQGVNSRHGMVCLACANSRVQRIPSHVSTSTKVPLHPRIVPLLAKSFSIHLQETKIERLNMNW